MQLKESVLDLKDLNDVTSWSEAKQKDFQLCRSLRTNSPRLLCCVTCSINLAGDVIVLITGYNNSIQFYLHCIKSQQKLPQ